MDGHSKSGKYRVTLELTGDMVAQLTRLIDLAKMINGRDIKTEKRPERFDVLAYREFLREILEILYKSIEGLPTPGKDGDNGRPKEGLS